MALGRNLFACGQHAAGSNRRGTTRFLAPFCGLLVLGTVAAAADINIGLVGHWRFDGCDGKVVKDRSPLGNDGVIDGGEMRKEKTGLSLELDGPGGHVLITEKSLFNFSNALTASLWVKAAELRRNTVPRRPEGVRVARQCRRREQRHVRHPRPAAQAAARPRPRREPRSVSAHRVLRRAEPTVTDAWMVV